MGALTEVCVVEECEAGGIPVLIGQLYFICFRILFNVFLFDLQQKWPDYSWQLSLCGSTVSQNSFTSTCTKWDLRTDLHDSA